MRARLFRLAWPFLLLAAPLQAKTDAVYSLQAMALAPNAGGQQAFALRRATDKAEWSLFANDYLRTGNQPLMGGLYSLRFPALGQSRGFQMVFEVGAGLSSVGPMVEVLWGTTLLWSVRLDVASHFYVAKDRAILWSYPLWIGLSVGV